MSGSVLYDVSDGPKHRLGEFGRSRDGQGKCPTVGIVWEKFEDVIRGILAIRSIRILHLIIFRWVRGDTGLIGFHGI